MKIFVNIVSYRDTLLWDTVNDCIDNCSDTSRLHFGIVDQSDSPYYIKNHRLHKQITYFHMNPTYSRGPCWARSVAYSFYTNEDYVLQVDAHTVFDQNWDSYLIGALNECTKFSKKSILSSYPQEFVITEQGIEKKQRPGVVTVFKPKEDSVITDDNPSFSFRGHNIRSLTPVKGIHIAGGFVFAPGNFFQEIPYDPTLYFIGEEQNIAIRAWTHGWDIYHYPGIPIYHLYHNNNSRPLHWDPNEDKVRSVRWFELRQRSRQRLSDLLFNGKNLGIYSLGKIRTLEQYKDFSGIDYVNKQVKILDQPIDIGL